jgi:two-component system cell cycle response regulator DivK
MRIVYAEDNIANLALVQRVARIGNHMVIHYMDGESVLEHFERDKPDLLLLDIQISGQLNGLEVVRRLRADGRTVPVVAVTAYAMVGDREKCLEAGCDAYMAKPMAVADLVEIIRRYDPLGTQTRETAQSPKPVSVTERVVETPAVSLEQPPKVDAAPPTATTLATEKDAHQPSQTD